MLLLIIGRQTHTYAAVTDRYNSIPHKITALIMKQLNYGCIYITLYTELNTSPAVKPLSMLHCQFGLANSTVLHTDCVLWFSVCITV